MGLPWLFLGFASSFFIAVGLMGVFLRLFTVDPDSEFLFFYFFVPTFLIVFGLAMKLVDCPRCKTSAFRHSGTRWNNAWPMKHCSKCDLDLRKYHPFDSRAKRDD